MIPTPHISAKKGDFADTVLMPGDPLRAKFIAEKFLDDAVCVSQVRGILAYTGYYKGKRVSVMASGMGQPSIGIYSYELFNFYDVKSIIRVGTCGAIDKDLHIKDVVIAMGACYNSNFANQYLLPGTYSAICDYSLLEKAVDKAKEMNIKFKVGNVLSTDCFYDDAKSGLTWGKMGVLGVEMESGALYMTASRFNKKALTILTVSDSLVNLDEIASSSERETAFTDMMKLALEIAE